jgi:hypothetical protein
MIQRRAADRGMRIKIGCHTPRRWLRTKARVPLSYMIAPATKSHSMRSSEYLSEAE